MKQQRVQVTLSQLKKHQNRPKRIENDVFSEFATFFDQKHQNRPKCIEKQCFQRISDFFDQQTPK